MLVERLNALRTRLDALGRGQAPAFGLVDRARLLFIRDDGVLQFEALRALDADLDLVGVHTVADARLLRELGRAKGRVGQISEGLTERAAHSLEEFEQALDEVERLVFHGTAQPGLVGTVEVDFRRLARIVKVALVFGEAGTPVPFEVFAEPGRTPQAAPPSARLAVAEFLAQRSRENVDDSVQKRRDLDMAHELLLRMSADATHDRERLKRVRLEVASARDRARSAAGVRSLLELARHVRHVARRDPRTAYRSMRAFYERAVEAGDTEAAALGAKAVAALLPSGAGLKAAVDRSEARRRLGWREPSTPPTPEAPLPAGGRTGLDDKVADSLAELAFSLGHDELDALQLAAGTARLFDIDDALGEEYVEAELKATRPVQRRVPYPTQLMSYEFTHSLDDLNHFVVSNPQSLLLDLASGQQMVRAYLEEEPPPKPKRMKKTAVRVYVLDASGSMFGARARFRDAILIAELNAIRVKARAGLPFDPLYYCFFNDSPTDLNRVDTGAHATHQITRLFAESPAEGQTDISLALMSAFESIGQAQGRDPYLARATVVLVTDGEDGIDLELVRRTRKPFSVLDISLSFISLGEENADLKSLVLEQRQGGGRAFYHHLSDAEITAARSDFDSAWRTLLPDEVEPSGAALERLLPHLEALEALALGRAVKPSVQSAAQFDTLFPEAPPPGRAPAPTVARLVDVLEAIGEAAALAPIDARAAEAVALLTHLLALYGLTLPRYLEALGADSEPLRSARAHVRLVCRPLR
jgi:hypothetical protein